MAKRWKVAKRRRGPKVLPIAALALIRPEQWAISVQQSKLRRTAACAASRCSQHPSRCLRGRHLTAPPAALPIAPAAAGTDVATTRSSGHCGSAPAGRSVVEQSPDYVWITAASGQVVLLTLLRKGQRATGCRVSMSRRRAVGRGHGPVSYLRAFASASSFSSWFTRSCNVDKRELNRPTLKNVTLLAGASRVLPYPSQDES